MCATMPSGIVTCNERSINCGGSYYYHYMGFAEGKGCGDGSKGDGVDFGGDDKGGNTG